MSVGLNITEITDKIEENRRHPKPTGNFRALPRIHEASNLKEMSFPSHNIILIYRIYKDGETREYTKLYENSRRPSKVYKTVPKASEATKSHENVLIRLKASLLPRKSCWKRIK